MLRLLVLAVLLVRLLVALLNTDLWDAITGVLNSIVSIPGDAVRAVWHAIKGIFDFFSHLGEILDSAWDWMVNGVEWLGSRVAWLGTAAWSIGKWVIERWVPMAVHWALGKAVAFTIGLWHTLERFVVGLVDGVVRFFKGAIHTVESWARAAFRWVTGELSKIGHWIAKAGGFVFGILAHPDRLVAWILSALIVPLIKFALGSGAPIVRWLFHSFASLAGELAGTLEKALADIL